MKNDLLLQALYSGKDIPDVIKRFEKELRDTKDYNNLIHANKLAEYRKSKTDKNLLTTVTVKSEKEIEKLVQCYAHRWKIERFHFILKSGCKIEKNQAREYGRLSFLTLLYSVIAMQILNLTYLGKICPEISSGIVFAEEEWKVLCCCARKSKEIPESYSLKEAIYDLGVLGGTKGAPSDGMPGVRSIWQGLDVLYSLLAYRNYLV